MILLESCASFLKVCQKQSSSGVWFYLFKKKGLRWRQTALVFSTLSLCCMLTQISVPEPQEDEPQRKESHPRTPIEGSAAVTPPSDCFTQHNSLFSKEVLQVTRGRHTSVLASVAPRGISVGLSFVFHSLTYKLYFPALRLFLMSNK